MAFSFRKMLSNINYFKKPDEEESSLEDPFTDLNVIKRQQISDASVENEHKCLGFERIEPDSTSLQCATSLKLPESVKIFGTKKGSLSDTDVLATSIELLDTKKRSKSKKLKLDIKKANQSLNEALDNYHFGSSNDAENTPKHMLLNGRSAEAFSERIKGFNFNKPLNIFDSISDDDSSPGIDDNNDIESVSENSDTDISLVSNIEEIVDIKMCRKVGNDIENNIALKSTTPESFADVEFDKDEEDCFTLLLDYQIKIEKLECFLKKLLSEFEFHIEVSKVFNSHAAVQSLSNTNIMKIPQMISDVNYLSQSSRCVSPIGSWNIVINKEDQITKIKLRSQLLSMKNNIDEFLNKYFKDNTYVHQGSVTCDTQKSKSTSHIRFRVNNKKKLKYFDFPDIREAMLNLFTLDIDKENLSVSNNNVTDLLSNYDESENENCKCKCHNISPNDSQTDSGLTTKNDRSMSSITSSIGNFSLDSTTLTAYSESLEQIVSYNSFDDTSIYSTLLQKAAIERITFYVQVHSIQLKCELIDKEFESKSTITFHCPTCKTIDTEENGLLKHILSQFHCEKIHFQYKTAYIKKCVSTGKEIQPSTILNPMTMYRDDNKIVCFGDAMFACSLCFESLIVGESVLMAHCNDPQHVDRRGKLSVILE